MATLNAVIKTLDPAHSAKRVKLRIPAVAVPVHAIDVVVGGPGTWKDGAYIEVYRPSDIPSDWQVELIPDAGITLTLLNGSKLAPGESARVLRVSATEWEALVWRYLPTPSTSTDFFLRADGTWAAPGAQASVDGGFGSSVYGGTSNIDGGVASTVFSGNGINGGSTI